MVYIQITENIFSTFIIIQYGITTYALQLVCVYLYSLFCCCHKHYDVILVILKLSIRCRKLISKFSFNFSTCDEMTSIHIYTMHLTACCQKHIYENQCLPHYFYLQLSSFFFCVISRFPKCNQIILKQKAAIPMQRVETMPRFGTMKRKKWLITGVSSISCLLLLPCML